MLPWVENLFYSLIHQKIWREAPEGLKREMGKGAAFGEMTGVQVRAGGCLFHHKSSVLYDTLWCYFDQKEIKAVRRWLSKDRNCAFKRQKPYVLWANAFTRISYKTLIRSANRNQSVPGYKMTDVCFQQSSQANALQWSQTNAAGNRKEHFCEWQRSLRGIREPLMSAPRGS